MAYLLLLYGLYKDYGIREPNLSYSHTGKPYLSDYPDIHFNISHCPQGCICAISDIPIGIDIQDVRPFSLPIAEHCCSAAELQLLKQSANPALEFTRMWAMKESYLKMTGAGITDDLHSVDTMKLTDKIHAWAISIIASTVYEWYNALESGEILGEKRYDYLSFVESEKEYFHSVRYEKDKAYWAEQYTSRPEICSIKPNSATVVIPTAKRYTTTLSAEVSAAINQFYTEHNISQAVLFEAAVITYLSRINPENHSISLGVPVLNRSGAAEKGAVGMCISTTPLTIPITREETAAELCNTISSRQFKLFRHQRFPYSHILHDLHERYEFSGNLYDVIVSFQNAKTGANAKTQWFSNGYCEVGMEFHIDNRDNADCYTLNMLL